MISLPAPAPPPTTPDDATLQRIEERCLERLWGLFEQRDFPGASVALVLPDGTELALPIGYADREAEREMSAEDLLLSGSIGKTYVTAAYHHMARVTHAGALELDQPVAEHLGELEWYARLPNADTITIGQLLRHQSGIGRYVFKPEFFATCLEQPDRVWKPAELLSHVFDDEPLFPAGEGWAYSDTNYIVLGMVLEHVAQQPFYEYVAEHLLEPHGLEHTVPSDRRRIPGLTQGYVVSTKSFGMPDLILEEGVFRYNPQFEWCGGGYASTAVDLARWARVLFRGEAFDAPYLEAMLDSVPAALGPGVEYGYGVMVRESELGPLLGHDGFMTGYTATMGYFPEQEVAVALMLNTDDARVMGVPLTRLVEELAGIAVEELGG